MLIRFSSFPNLVSSDSPSVPSVLTSPLARLYPVVVCPTVLDFRRDKPQGVDRFKVLDVICAPPFTNAEGLSTEVAVDLEEGKKHSSWIHV